MRSRQEMPQECLEAHSVTSECKHVFIGSQIESKRSCKECQIEGLGLTHPFGDISFMYFRNTISDPGIRQSCQNNVPNEIKRYAQRSQQLSHLKTMDFMKHVLSITREPHIGTSGEAGRRTCFERCSGYTCLSLFSFSN